MHPPFPAGRGALGGSAPDPPRPATVMARFKTCFKLLDSRLDPEAQLVIIGSVLVPGWVPDIWELRVSLGDASGEYWSTDCSLADETLFELRVNRANLESTLVVDPNPLFRPPQSTPRWLKWLLLASALFGGAVGLKTGRIHWGLLAAFAPLAVQLLWD